MVRQLCFLGAGFAAASAVFCWKLGQMDLLAYMSLWSGWQFQASPAALWENEVRCARNTVANHPPPRHAGGMSPQTKMVAGAYGMLVILALAVIFTAW